MKTRPRGPTPWMTWCAHLFSSTLLRATWPGSAGRESGSRRAPTREPLMSFLNAAQLRSSDSVSPIWFLSDPSSCFFHLKQHTYLFLLYMTGFQCGKAFSYGLKQIGLCLFFFRKEGSAVGLRTCESCSQTHRTIARVSLLRAGMPSAYPPSLCSVHGKTLSYG